MISDEINLEKPLIEKLDNEIDEFLCYEKFFYLTLSLGQTTSITCQPYKGSWLITIYHHYGLTDQKIYDSFPEAFQKFQEFCCEFLSDINQKHRIEQ